MPDIGFHSQLIEAMKRRATPAGTIERFVRHLRALPAGSDLPCPFCFALGRDGTLLEQTKTTTILSMRCASCGEQVVFRDT